MLRKLFLTTIFIFFSQYLRGNIVSLDYPFSIKTNFYKYNFTLKWNVDWKEQLVKFSLNFPTTVPYQTVMIGFSDHGNYEKTDFCLLSRYTIFDGFIDNELNLLPDIQQDCQNYKKLNNDNYYFERKFITCDPKDYAMDTGQSQFLIAIFSKEFSNLMDADEKKFLYAIILDEYIPNRKKDLDTEKVVFYGATNSLISSERTSYKCFIKRIDDSILAKKHHIIEYKSFVTPGNEHIVHHMEIFLCIGSKPTDNLDYEGSCQSKKRPKKSSSCSKVIGAWAFGAGPFEYPDEAGIAFGGKHFPAYIMVEIHYNNEKNESNFIDSSGILITYTEKLRKYDAGIMELGLIYSDANSIPPGQKAFPMTGYCVPECTKHLPTNGIYIFATQLHAHLTGRKLFTSHFRNGVKIGEINRANHYSPHWQLIRKLKKTVNVKKGDYLSTTCVYDTYDKTNFVFGGYGIEDEMCVNYIHYYPESVIEVCKSAINNKTLEEFFLYNIQDLEMNNEYTINQKFEMLNYDNNVFDNLKELYAVGNLNVHCLGHDGKLIKGKTNWENIEKPRTSKGSIFAKTISEHECLTINN
ncbi:DBH-like monooxygenase protein 1 [Strongyloides ratti]|uniref:DBH-like monooxygenase protein 1 n=1 Tax=Strongyloides ratti TaxID=34506 RepID=A0A090LHZ3_STRRB|nr:DBH-like monooxygenase protein 1 [Strongyloides ratti]CEF69436.1 DBH-like monooxygenase protein 1 [Strongyloides ratti]